MLHAHIKNATACAVSWTGLAGLLRSNPFIVFYHRVVERLDMSNGMALPAMEISVPTLERHLDWLNQHYQIVSLDALETTSGSRPVAAVTFDDGYSDVYHYAFPLLKRKGIPAGIFVITDLVGSTEPPLHEKLHALLVEAARQSAALPEELNHLLQADPFSMTRFLLARLPNAHVQRIVDCLEDAVNIDEGWDEGWRNTLRPMSWEMLAEMRDCGMTIGSHSKTHAFLNNESEERVGDETLSSRQTLRRMLGVDIQCFAYPGGSFNRSVVHAVAAAGYRYAFTICRHRDRQYPSLTIPRIGMWERACLDPSGHFSPPIMSCQAAGAFNWASRCTQAHTA